MPQEIWIMDHGLWIIIMDSYGYGYRYGLITKQNKTDAEFYLRSCCIGIAVDR